MASFTHKRVKISQTMSARWLRKRECQAGHDAARHRVILKTSSCRSAWLLVPNQGAGQGWFRWRWRATGRWGRCQPGHFCPHRSDTRRQSARSSRTGCCSPPLPASSAHCPRCGLPARVWNHTDYTVISACMGLKPHRVHCHLFLQGSEITQSTLSSAHCPQCSLPVRVWNHTVTSVCKGLKSHRVHCHFCQQRSKITQITLFCLLSLLAWVWNHTEYTVTSVCKGLKSHRVHCHFCQQRSDITHSTL